MAGCAITVQTVQKIVWKKTLASDLLYWTQSLLHLVDSPLFVTRETNLVTSVLVFCTPSPFLKMGLLRKERIHCQGSKMSVDKKDPIRKVDKSYLPISLESLSIPLKCEEWNDPCDIVQQICPVLSGHCCKSIQFTAFKTSVGLKRVPLLVDVLMELVLSWSHRPEKPFSLTWHWHM